MGAVSMYVDMLSSAVGAWDAALSREALLDHTVDCRVRMLATGTAHGASAYDALAAEIAYDRALIHLCSHVGIGASPRWFDQPDAERTRLEQTLAEMASIDLVSLSRGRAEDLA